ncbi:MAG TPA: ABC transporter permease [Polyangiaceae bacterium]
MTAVFTAIRLAFTAIRRNLLRATLTVFGILVGVAAVVTVTALGAGARDSVGHQLDSIGSNLIFVWPDRVAVSGARTKGAGRMTEEDGRAVVRESVSLAGFHPQLMTRVSIVYGDSNTTTNVLGTSLSFFTLHNWDVARGKLWDEHEEATKAKVCILGQTVATHLFGSTDPVGRVIRIGNFPYTVVGVLTPKGEIFGNDQDDTIVMPIGGVRSRFVHTAPGQVNALTFASTTSDNTDRAVAQITQILRQRHRLPEGSPSDFEVKTQKDLQEMQGSIYVILTLLLVAIAAISLIVGGIGIMNIMLVSVTERTREIGIRMAIGAREADIRTQFLVEATVLSLLGGLGGVALGGVLIAGIGKALDWNMSMDPLALTVSVIVSAAIGIGFGFFPARRASRLDPIEALRHE